LNGRRGNSKEKGVASVKTFFFTDRAIYRPGQTIYFKGIVVKSDKGDRENNIIADSITTVVLYNTNFQKIDTLRLKTNAFGSFQGKFMAPSGLTGSMSIGNSTGRVAINVEEYKRPKFFVDFDTIKTAYTFNEQVSVKGMVKAYAGNNIDGAKVTYRVVRNARFPYYWCFYRFGMQNSDEMEMTNGIATTDVDGTFKVNFKTIPDKMIDPRSLPLFTYTVYADVTDINGETHSGNTTINCAYRSMQIKTNIQEDGRPDNLVDIQIRTENNNDVFVSAQMKITIARLHSPGFLRTRLWAKPDQFIMSETAFHQAFPGDEYNDESNHLNWDKEAVVFEKNIQTTIDGKVAIAKETWSRNGWYLIEISGKDAQGNDVTEKVYTHVWLPGRKDAPQKGLNAYTGKDTYLPGESLEIWHATGIEHPYLLTMGKRGGKKMDVSSSVNPLKIIVTEQDRGGIDVAWLYVYDNRVYTVAKNIVVPWDNKDLHISWATHRDKLQPVAKEQWTMTITGNKKEKIAAELLATLYDASLDAITPHFWNQPYLFSQFYPLNGWNSRQGFGVGYAKTVAVDYRSMFYESYEKRYDKLALDDPEDWISFASSSPVKHMRLPVTVQGADNPDAIDPGLAPSLRFKTNGGDNMGVASGFPYDTKPFAVTRGGVSEDKNSDAVNDTKAQYKNIQARKNLNETAFFLPQLKTDSSGNISLSFIMPEALTEWKLMAFAHTRDLQTGYMEGKIKTQKDLMVVPNMPRFLRQNDNIQISTKIVNLSNHNLKGDATVELLDAQTLLPIPFQQFQQMPWSQSEFTTKGFLTIKGQSTTVTWNLHVPESCYHPVVVRIVATSGTFSDGEENTLPVITNRILVTETWPFSTKGNERSHLAIDKLVNNTSPTLVNHSLTFEYTANPSWYVVQALPYLMEYPYECAEQNFNGFYANALACNIIRQSPKIRQVFEQWQQKDTLVLVSNLQKNEDLKTSLLEETPWVMEAQNETAQKQRIAALFQSGKLKEASSKSLDKLMQIQLPDGSFPWFKGMAGDRFITQYIITGMGRLQHLGVKNVDSDEIEQWIGKALGYADNQITNDYNQLQRTKVDLQVQQIVANQVQYLYMRSFFPNAIVDTTDERALDYFKTQAKKYWPRFNPCLKAQIALTLKRMGDIKTAIQITASLKETAIQNQDLGMYWNDKPDNYNWWEAPVESQAQLIEAFAEITNDKDAIDAMEFWLLKQKQTHNWETTKATADACYAFLLNGNNVLDNELEVTVHLGNEIVTSNGMASEAGTGYFQKQFSGKEVKKEMGNINIQVQDTKPVANTVNGWGAVYWQYFEEMDKVTTATAPVHLEKQLFIERNSSTGPVLTAITNDNKLQVGDKVKIRIIVKVDRDMEYVQLKDMRAACFEPIDILSRYNYQNGVGYYQSTKDLATHFFFDHLAKGTYVFEYAVWVNAKGDFSNGISTIQCMYAPEFSSHTEGLHVVVE
jgi:uncharacterized protein YfaS (alpha-2-macroglobulin family)